MAHAPDCKLYTIEKSILLKLYASLLCIISLSAVYTCIGFDLGCI